MSTEQKYIRVLFYLTPWKLKRKYLINQIISIRTLSKYSHCELWAADENGDFIAIEHIYATEVSFGRSDEYCTSTLVLPQDIISYLGTCYSSTMRDDEDGTRAKDASLVLKHPEHWHYVLIPVTDEQYEVLIWWLKQKVAANKGYAKRDIWKFVIGGIHKPDDERDICSELGNNGLAVIMIILGFGIVSPGKLLKKLLNRGYEVKPLN